MELAERYIYKIYEEGSLSLAAKKLFVSQPALSATLAKQEKKLGFRIFDRTRAPLKPTATGLIYLDHLHDVIVSESNMQLRIQQITNTDYSVLSVGGLCQSVGYFLPTICRIFRETHPAVSITVDAGPDYSHLMEKLKSHTLDLMLAYQYDEHFFRAVPIVKERYIIAASKKIESAFALAPYAVTREQVLRGTIPPEKTIADPSLFKHVPFLNSATVAASRVTTKLLHEFFNPSVFHVKNASNSVLHYGMMLEGLGAVFVSDTHLLQPCFACDDLLFFVLQGETYRTLRAVTSKTAPDSPLVREFTETAQHFFADITRERDTHTL